MFIRLMFSVQTCIRTILPITTPINNDNSTLVTLKLNHDFSKIPSITYSNTTAAITVTTTPETTMIREYRCISLMIFLFRECKMH